MLARLSTRTITIWDRILVGVALIAAWQAASWHFGAYWISGPWSTLQRFGADLGAEMTFIHLWTTTRSALLGFLIGGVPAVLLPFLLRRKPFINAVLDPFMVAGYGIPKVSLAPLFILWFGIGIESKVAVVAIAAFFILFFTAQAGVRSLDSGLVHMAQVAGASERRVLQSVVLPAALPHIFSGIRISAPYSVGAAVITEMISSNRGLGYMLAMAGSNYDATGFFAGLILVTLLVLAVNLIVSACERRFLGWRPSSSGSARASASGGL